MLISTVKKWQGGFKVNNQFWIPEDSANEDYKSILLWQESGGVVEDEFSQEELLEKAKFVKKQALKQLRDCINLSPTPRNGGAETYRIGNDYVTFKLSASDIPMINSIISYLSSISSDLNPNPTRGWTDINGVRWQLNIELFRSIVNHLLARDEQAFDLYNSRLKLLDSINSLEDVENFDINQIPDEKTIEVINEPNNI